MTKGWGTSILNRLFTHPRLLAAGVVIALLFSLIGFLFIPFKHSMDIMLPEGSETQEAILLLQNIDFSAKVALSFSQTDDTLNRGEFFDEIDRFTESIRSPQIAQVLSTFDDQQMVRDMGAFLGRAPELLSEAEVDQVTSRFSREGVARSLRRKYIQLLSPEGSFMSGLIQRDPLDIQQIIIDRFRVLSASFGYDIRMENNHLVSADGKQVLLILETTVPFTDAAGARELVDLLTRQIDTLPDSIRAEMICGHMHTLSNEKVIKRDIGLTVTVVSIAFILLFLFFFKDWRAVLIFCVPLAALPLAVNCTAWMTGTLSPMMLGFGSVIAGIAVDYGIHVYIAVRRSDHALKAVRAIVKPVLFGALTTAGVFVAFFFSSIPGYHQLAGFALFSVLFSATAALLILPVYLIPKGAKELFPKIGTISLRRAWITLMVFVGLLAAALPVALRAPFDSDIMQLDGTEKKILDAEAAFQEQWGTGGAGQAVAVVSASNEESALQLNDQVYETLVDACGPDDVASLSAIWKSEAQREAAAARWSALWTPSQISKLKALFREEGTPFGFAPDAFDPFFQWLETPVVIGGEPKDNALFLQFKTRFVQQEDGRTQLLTFLPDRPEFIEPLSKMKTDIPGLLVISRQAIAEALAQDYTREFSRISGVALGLILLISALLLRNLRKTLIVLTPACAGIASIAVVVALTGSALNVMNLISGIIVIGLCVDYGIFHVHSYTNQLNLGTRTAITLSAGTTLIGAGALLFTLHPALFSVGLTLVGGISAGYATAMWVVPSLCRLFLKESS